jgi:hypothetical protein
MIIYAVIPAQAGIQQYPDKSTGFRVSAALRSE